MGEMHAAVSGGYTPEERYGKVLIMGRAQTGKTTLTKKLADATGLKLLKTSTTRPKRHPGEDTYHFYTPEEGAAVPMEEKLFHTLAVDGFERWTGRQDFLDAGIAVLDPTAMIPAVQLWQAQGYRVCILYLEEDKGLRRTRWMHEMSAPDGSDWDAAIAAFAHRESVEAPMFDALEKSIEDIRELDAFDAALWPNASPEKRRICGEDLLLTFQSRGRTQPEEFLPGFMGALAAGARPAGGYRESRSREDLGFEPGDWTEGEWRTICRILGLVPENTARAAISRPLVKYWSAPGNENSYKPEQPRTIVNQHGANCTHIGHVGTLCL